MRRTKVLLSVLLVLISLILVGCSKEEQAFYLDEKYYGNSEYIDLDKETLDNLVDENKSFVIFIYQPLCFTSFEFNKVLDEFLETNKISFYKMSFSDMKETELGKQIKYYPSFVIYHNGKLISYLDASSDLDKEYYSSKDGFKKWFTKYVLLK